MFEHHREDPLPRHRFFRRMVNSIVVAMAVIGISLGIGMLGYHFIAGLHWIDAFQNAAMILSGMGPVDELHSNAAKIFAGCYALFSGIVFLSTAAILFAPLAHRLMHRFHVPTDQDEQAREKAEKKKKPA